jgi:uncharacterized protein
LKTVGDYAKPLPRIDASSRPYWEHARRHELSVQHCRACGHHQFPPAPVCSDCLCEDLTWKVVSGRGKLVAWIEFHRAYWPGFADDLPYNVAVVELEEGPQIVSNLVGDLAAALAADLADKPGELRQGLALRAVFDDVTPEISLVRFDKA